MTLSSLEIEPQCQSLMEVVVRFVTRVQARRQSAAQDGASVDYGAIEKEFAEHAAALERQAHAIVLKALDIDAPQVNVDGQAYRRVLRCPGTYYTMVGAVQIPRTLYRKVGERIGATVDAISLRAGVIGKGWLPRTASAMAWECQRAPSREAQKASEQWLRLPYSRSAFRSVAHRVAEQYGQKREAVERQLIETLQIPEKAHSVSVSMDRVSIPMEEPRPSQLPASQSAVEDSVESAQVEQMATECAPFEVKKKTPSGLSKESIGRPM
jgi:hypothetical protein